MGEGPLRAADRAEFTRLQQGPEAPVEGIGALVEHHGADQPRAAPGAGEQPAGRGDLGGHGFFHEQMEAGPQHGAADAGVREMRRGDEDRVNGAGVDQGLWIGEGRGRGEFGEAGRIQVGDGSEAEKWHRAGANLPGVRAAHLAEADDAEADGFHAGAAGRPPEGGRASGTR